MAHSMQDITLPVFLVGFMGSGKTYWGNSLSKALHLPFADLDAVIEKEQQQQIAAIFKEKGESAFRMIEANVLRSFEKQQSIVSCGGGTPCYHSNMQWMNAHGLTVYLHASPALLAERLQPEKEHRPLISTIADMQLETFIAEKLRERLSYYQQARLTLDVATLSLDVFIHKLSSFISMHHE